MLTQEGQFACKDVRFKAYGSVKEQGRKKEDILEPKTFVPSLIDRPKIKSMEINPVDRYTLNVDKYKKVTEVILLS